MHMRAERAAADAADAADTERVLALLDRQAEELQRMVRATAELRGAWQQRRRRQPHHHHHQQQQQHPHPHQQKL